MTEPTTTGYRFTMRRACGHEETVTLHGNQERRNEQRRRARTEVCNDCCVHADYLEKCSCGRTTSKAFAEANDGRCKRCVEKSSKPQGSAPWLAVDSTGALKKDSEERPQSKE